LGAVGEKPKRPVSPAMHSYYTNSKHPFLQVISAAVTTAEGSQLKKQIQELKLAIEKLLI